MAHSTCIPEKEADVELEIGLSCDKRSVLHKMAIDDDVEDASSIVDSLASFGSLLEDISPYMSSIWNRLTLDLGCSHALRYGNGYRKGR